MITAKIHKRHTEKCNVGYREEVISHNRPMVSWCSVTTDIKRQLGAAGTRCIRLRQGDRISYMTVADAAYLIQQLDHHCKIVDEYERLDLERSFVSAANRQLKEDAK